MLFDPSRSTDDQIARRSHLAKASNSYVLLTGATGLVGQYLVRDLMKAGCQVAVVARPSRKLNCQQRIESIMQRWDRLDQTKWARPVILPGDVRRPRLGLSEADMDWVSDHVDTILHNAAILQFDRDCTSEPWATNVRGTQHALDLADCCDVENFHYVSTAYRCGIQHGRVTEDSLDCGQVFRNDYERSKYEAELLVRGSNIKNASIYRPAVIVGDSKTGFTSSYHGLFVYLRLMALLIPQQQRDENGVALTPIQLPMSGDEQRNLVPVDWVSQVITRLVTTPESLGHTFHLAPDKPATPREIIDYCCRYFNSTGVEYIGSGEQVDANQQSQFAAQFLQNTGMYHAYDCNDPSFDRENLMRFAGDIPCPRIDEACIHRFIDYGESDCWGKRRATPPDCEFWLTEHLPAIQIALMELCSTGQIDRPTTAIGLSVRGPGGSDWTFNLGSGSLVLEKGIHAPPHRVIVTQADTLSQQLSELRGNWRPLLASWLPMVNDPEAGASSKLNQRVCTAATAPK